MNTEIRKEEKPAKLPSVVEVVFFKQHSLPPDIVDPWVSIADLVILLNRAINNYEAVETLDRLFPGIDLKSVFLNHSKKATWQALDRIFLKMIDDIESTLCEQPFDNEVISFIPHPASMKWTQLRVSRTFPKSIACPGPNIYSAFAEIQNIFSEYEDSNHRASARICLMFYQRVADAFASMAAGKKRRPMLTMEPKYAFPTDLRAPAAKIINQSKEESTTMNSPKSSTLVSKLVAVAPGQVTGAIPILEAFLCFDKKRFITIMPLPRHTLSEAYPTIDFLKVGKLSSGPFADKLKASFIELLDQIGLCLKESPDPTEPNHHLGDIRAAVAEDPFNEKLIPKIADSIMALQDFFDANPNNRFPWAINEFYIDILDALEKVSHGESLTPPSETPIPEKEEAMSSTTDEVKKDLEVSITDILDPGSVWPKPGQSFLLGNLLGRCFHVKKVSACAENRVEYTVDIERFVPQSTVVYDDYVSATTELSQLEKQLLAADRNNDGSVTVRFSEMDEAVRGKVGFRCPGPKNNYGSFATSFDGMNVFQSSGIVLVEGQEFLAAEVLAVHGTNLIAQLQNGQVVFGVSIFVPRDYFEYMLTDGIVPPAAQALYELVQLKNEKKVGIAATPADGAGQPAFTGLSVTIHSKGGAGCVGGSGGGAMSGNSDLGGTGGASNLPGYGTVPQFNR